MRTPRVRPARAGRERRQFFSCPDPLRGTRLGVWRTAGRSERLAPHTETASAPLQCRSAPSVPRRAPSDAGHTKRARARTANTVKITPKWGKGSRACRRKGARRR